MMVLLSGAPRIAMLFANALSDTAAFTTSSTARPQPGITLSFR
jgi:hypothetical protein